MNDKNDKNDTDTSDTSMSKNDVILVAKYKNMYYVIYLDCADLDFIQYAKNKIESSELKYTYSRSKGLLIAHNKQKKLDTEYGVREISCHL